MNATPEGQKVSRVTRFRELTKRAPVLPPLHGAEHLLNCFYSVGVCRVEGMGVVGISWSELHAWQVCSNLRLSGWESETVFIMSNAYANQLAVSRDRNAEPPYCRVKPRAQREREDLSAGILAAFETLAKRER